MQEEADSLNFLAYTSFFPINSNVLMFDKSQKVYSVNKGLFLGVFLTMVYIHGQVPRCDLSCFILVNYLRFNVLVGF